MSVTASVRNAHAWVRCVRATHIRPAWFGIAASPTTLLASHPENDERRRLFSTSGSGAPYRRFSESVRKLLSALVRGGGDAQLFPEHHTSDGEPGRGRESDGEGIPDALDQLIEASCAHDARATRRLSAHIRWAPFGDILYHTHKHWRRYYGDNVAVALAGLVRTTADLTPGEFAALRILQQPQFLKLLDLLGQRAALCSPESIVSIAQSLTSLRVPWTHRAWGHVVARAESDLDAYSASQAASIAWSWTSAKTDEGPLVPKGFDRFLGCVVEKVAGVPEFDKIPLDSLARLAWILASRRMECGKFFDLFRERVSRAVQAGAGSSEVLWRAAVSLAAMEIDDDEVYEALAVYLIPELDTFSTSVLCQLAEAYGQRGAGLANSRRLIRRIAEVTPARSLNPSQSAKLLDAFARLDLPPPNMHQWANAAARRAAMASSDELVALVRALRLLRYGGSSAWSTFANEIVQRQHQFTDQQLVSVLGDLGAIGCRREDVASAITSRFSAALDKAGAPDIFPADACADLLYACAELNIVPPESILSPSMLNYLSQAVRDQVLTALHQAQLAWALVALKRFHLPVISQVLGNANTGVADSVSAYHKILLFQADVSVRHEVIPVIKGKKSGLTPLKPELRHNFMHAFMDSQHFPALRRAPVFVEVRQIVQSLGCSVKSKVRGGEGYFLTLADEERKLAFQIFGREDFALDDPSVCAVGRTLLTLRHLRGLGWKVIPLTSFLWDKLADRKDKVTFLSMKMTL